MRAIFIGTDSMGFEQGKEYDLASYLHNGFIWVKDLSGAATDCPYANIEAFFNNWHLISKKMVINNDE